MESAKLLLLAVLGIAVYLAVTAAIIAVAPYLAIITITVTIIMYVRYTTKEKPPEK